MRSTQDFGVIARGNGVLWVGALTTASATLSPSCGSGCEWLASDFPTCDTVRAAVLGHF